MDKEELELLRRIEKYLTPSMTVNAIYRTPAASMRIVADELEAKDHDIAAFRNLIARLATPNN